MRRSAPQRPPQNLPPQCAAGPHRDVAVQYLCANHHPDHASICVFRTANRAA
jgi:hypothetical protein